MNYLAPMKNCPGGGVVQGNLNWMPRYRVGVGGSVCKIFATMLLHS